MRFKEHWLRVIAVFTTITADALLPPNWLLNPSYRGFSTCTEWQLMQKYFITISNVSENQWWIAPTEKYASKIVLISGKKAVQEKWFHLYPPCHGILGDYIHYNQFAKEKMFYPVAVVIWGHPTVIIHCHGKGEHWHTDCHVTSV